MQPELRHDVRQRLTHSLHAEPAFVDASLARNISPPCGGEGSSTAKLDKLVARMERDEFDLIADPTWAEKVRTGNSSALEDFDAAPLAELV